MEGIYKNTEDWSFSESVKHTERGHFKKINLSVLGMPKDKSGQCNIHKQTFATIHYH